MSLRVWLPLNGNLNNQGLSDVAVTNNGATIDNNGKIGKCYSFGTSTSYLTLSNDAMNGCTTECSLSFWLNIISWNTSYATYFQAGLGGTPWNHYIFGVLRAGTASNLCFTISNGSSASNASYTTPDLELNTWYHLTFVYKTGHCLIYVNGVLHQDYTTTIVPNFSGITKTTVGACNSGSNYQTNCKLNDFRIYDHALSPKEIEILSRGLVCHYPLNGNGGGQPNLYDFESVASKWRVTTGAELTLVDATDDVYGNVLKITSPSSANSERIYRGVKNVWEADTNFTVSFLAKASKTTVLKIERSRTDYAPDITVGTTWKRYSTVIPCSATTTGGALGIQTSTASADIYLTQIKVELGDKATAYCPGKGDSHYIPLGYDSTTEYDVSGYGYNGTKNGIFTYSTDTARYSVSSVFNGSTYISSNPSLSQIQTISVWCKTTKNKNTSQIVVACKESLLCVSFYNGNIISYFGNSNAGTGSKCWIGNSYIENGWNHIVVVATGTNTRKVYINGVELSPNSNDYWSDSVNGLFIGTRNTSSSPNNFYGNISDVRLYATALSADQIAELYNTAVSVANNGTLMGYELVEV